MAIDPFPQDIPWKDLGAGLAIRGVGVSADLVEPIPRRRSDVANEEKSTQSLDAAMSRVGMREVNEVELAFDATAPVRRRRSEGEVGAAQVVQLSVEPPPPEHEQVVLAVSEEGVLTWHIHDPEASTDRRRGYGGGARVYSIPVHAWDEAQDASRCQGRRGILMAVGKKLVKVIVFPVTDLVLGPIEKFLALKWEHEHAPYVCRTFTPENYKASVLEQLTADQWKVMGSGRALLFIHGTFSSAQADALR